jgi:hypothetical protein
MERFRDFVIAAYRNGDESITLDEFLEIVSTHENGESIHDAKKRLNLEMYLFGIYEDGVKLLRRFEGK